MPITRIIIADDHNLFVDGIKMLLENNLDIEILAVANDGKQLLDILNKTTPDIILLDINMPKLNGLEAARKITMQYKNIKIIILSTYKEHHLVQKAVEIGAKGYLLKDITRDELIECISSVMNNLTYFPKKIVKNSLNEFERDDKFVKLHHLTKREIEVLNLIKRGHTNNEMADLLFLSVYTIETHRKNIMQKLGIKTPAALFNFISENNF